MKKILFFALIVFGIISGIISTKLIKSLSSTEPEISTAPLAPSPVSSVIKTDNSSINFLIRERSIPKPPTENTINRMNSLMSKNGITFNLAYDKTKSPFIKLKQIINDDINSGILDTTRVAQAIKLDQSNTMAIFATSPHDNEKCFSEIGYVVRKEETRTEIEDFINSNMAITTVSQQIANISLKSLKKEKIKFNDLFQVSNDSEGIKLLKSKQVDLLIIRLQKFPNGSFSTKLTGKVEDPTTTFKDMQIIYTSDFKIPCKTIFLRNLSSEVKKVFKDNFINALKDPTNTEVFFETIGVRSIYEINQEEWDHITKIIANAPTDKLKKYFRNIVKMNADEEREQD